ncbi:MAG: 23S rRNA (uracil(1939)-C(5))-methyltransferase RlmD [Bacteroidales bacterium]|nr:23S rRNA (uracil(1939)-C(5))-methyltransferase RlmD [Bacteroidales bacterium]MDD3988504.1 23S rRNA (uracil(1939)-C(5))-methyltransferase RlmD [Bacteroidales bacterium]MDD4639612.1 23S rRNA (uracil(1939)-C(5))-methyltransferase RlmD [Bacteroidales bacterium]
MVKKTPQILESVKIESVASEGKAIAHINGKVLFVTNAIPGDVADIRILRSRKGYMEGKILRFSELSPDRTEPVCSHFGVCGGCKWQMLPYRLQLKFKEQQVIDQLKRIGRLDLPEISPILGSEKIYEYRNKLEFTFSANRWIEKYSEAENIEDEQRKALGFHISGMFDKVLDIKKCYLQPEPSNEVRLFIKEFALANGLTFFNLREQTGFLRNIQFRNSSIGQTMVTVVFYYEDKEKISLLLDAVRLKFIELTSINYIINDKKNDSISDLPVINYSGADAIDEDMDGLKFRIGPKSFFQTNTSQSLKMYRIAKEFAGLTGNETVYDLYTGTGTIALFMASGAKKVIGIEYVPEAIEDALFNAENNGIKNARFFAGDMKDILKPSFIEDNGIPDVLILDPPRAGIHPDVAKVIVEANPSIIVYISCNPATQARDLAMMSHQYRITNVQPLDMFPHTHHLENIVRLERKPYGNF